MGFLDWFTSSTPGGIAGEAGQKIIGGVFTGIKDLIEEFHLSPEQAQQMKLKLADLELQSYQAQVSDIQSARSMQGATHSVWPGILTAINTIGFFTVMGLIIAKGLPKVDEAGGQVILLLIGALISGYTSSLAFWLGSNYGARARDQMLANSIPVSAVSAITQK